MAAGRHTISYNASNLSSGVYVYAIQSGQFSYSRKMILLNKSFLYVNDVKEPGQY